MLDIYPPLMFSCGNCLVLQWIRIFEGNVSCYELFSGVCRDKSNGQTFNVFWLWKPNDLIRFLFTRVCFQINRNQVSVCCFCSVSWTKCCCGYFLSFPFLAAYLCVGSNLFTKLSHSLSLSFSLCVIQVTDCQQWREMSSTWTVHHLCCLCLSFLTLSHPIQPFLSLVLSRQLIPLSLSVGVFPPSRPLCFCFSVWAHILLVLISSIHLTFRSFLSPHLLTLSLSLRVLHLSIWFSSCPSFSNFLPSH